MSLSLMRMILIMLHQQPVLCDKKLALEQDRGASLLSGGFKTEGVITMMLQTNA